MATTVKEDKKPRLVKLMTLQEVALQTGISYMTLRRMVLEGHLPSVQLTGRRRFWVKPVDVERLIERSTSTMTPGE